jgi:Lar family restriction alleviation protein
MPEKVKLKPCPFCGSKDIKIGMTEALEFLYCYCNSCNSKGELCNMEESAIEAWNRRVSDERRRSR